MRIIWKEILSNSQFGFYLIILSKVFKDRLLCCFFSLCQSFFIAPDKLIKGFFRDNTYIVVVIEKSWEHSIYALFMNSEGQ